MSVDDRKKEKRVSWGFERVKRGAVVGIGVETGSRGWYQHVLYKEIVSKLF